LTRQQKPITKYSYSLQCYKFKHIVYLQYKCWTKVVYFVILYIQ